MKKYFICPHVHYCYPCEVAKPTIDFGVLHQYIGKYFTRDQIDEIICKMVLRHPYVEGAMQLEISVQWEENGVVGYYHSFEFQNENYKIQNKSNTEIKYECSKLIFCCPSEGFV